tara:strand:- start:120 stop:320 length:201 start_codon:yes stop_codon:yes gene_type:complete
MELYLAKLVVVALKHEMVRAAQDFLLNGAVALAHPTIQVAVVMGEVLCMAVVAVALAVTIVAVQVA